MLGNDPSAGVKHTARYRNLAVVFSYETCWKERVGLESVAHIRKNRYTSFRNEYETLLSIGKGRKVDEETRSFGTQFVPAS